jgi:aromatic amino acid transport protein AroP
MIPGIQVSVYVIPLWLLVMFACYRLKRSRAAQPALALAE